MRAGFSAVRLPAGRCRAAPELEQGVHGQRLRRLEHDPAAAPIVECMLADPSGAPVSVPSPRVQPRAHPLPPARNRHRPSAKGMGQERYVGDPAEPALHQPRGVEPPTPHRRTARRRRRGGGLPVQGSETSRTSGSGRTSERTSPSTPTSFAAPRSVAEHREAVRKPRIKRTYCLSSLIYCGECGCGFRSEFAGATGKHPR